MAVQPATRRVKMTCGALSGVDVLRISLVDRGANRVPFRITKRDGQAEEGNGVLNFSKIFQGEKTSGPVEVAAVVVQPDADLDQAKATVEAAGYSTENLVEGDTGHKAFVQGEGEFDPDACQMIKFAENLGVFVRGAEEIQKRASQDFGDNLGAQQFIPGVFMAGDALTSSITTILDEAENQGAAATAIKAAAQQHADFIGGLAEKIPADVFKLEVGFDSQEPKAEEKEEAKKSGDAQAKKAETDADAKDKGVKKGEDDDGSRTSSDEGKEVKKSDPEQDKGKATEPDPVLKAIEGLGAQLKTVGDRVEEVAKTAEEAKALAQKADKTTSAVGGRSEEDPEPTLRFKNGIRKSEGDDRLIDTAFYRPED